MLVTRNVVCRADTANATNDLLRTEEETTPHAMSNSASAQLVNPCYGTIDLSTREGKQSCQKATLGIPTTEKCSGDSKDIFKFIERAETHKEDFG